MNKIILTIIVLPALLSFAFAASDSPDANTFEPQAGFIQVYSKTLEFNDIDGSVFVHQSYNIYTENGEKVKTVPASFAPQLVRLAPGRYVVQCSGGDEKNVKINVLIKKGQITSVDQKISE
ncbi:MAG: hypothetical protein GWP06_09575 [Actinobacteria bacterium]|nr:hypothetical protein [Actinomycetota bacterium]